MSAPRENAPAATPARDPQDAGESSTESSLPAGGGLCYGISVGGGRESKQLKNGRERWRLTPSEGQFVTIEDWSPARLKEEIESMVGLCAWWSPHRWEPTMVRGKNGTKRQWRGKACWRSASCIMLDIDTPDHEPLTDDQRDALRQAAASLPGNLLYMTPAGSRLTAVLPETETDSALLQAAWAGFSAQTRTALDAAGLSELEVDASAADLARIFYAPNATAKGVERQAEVILLREQMQSAKVWSEAAPRATEPKPQWSVGESGFVCPYYESPHGLVWQKPTRDGAPVPLLIANFSARIVGDVFHDDGAETQRVFDLEGRVGTDTQRFILPARQFVSVATWASEQLGSKAVVFPGHGGESHVRAAIQLLSKDVPQRTVFRQTGWRDIGDQFVYLNASGAVGPDGCVEDIEVDLPGKLKHFALPEPPDDEALREAVAASLSFRRIARDDLSLPLLAVPYRAALGRCEVSPYLDGTTGAGKSEVAALLQQHFGPALNRLNLPGNWHDTANALGALAFSAADALVVIDDFVPKGNRHEVSALQRKAEQVLRGQGNGQGRGRCNPDGTLRAERPPRGMVLVTGEDTPQGESLRARLLVFTLAGQLKDGSADIRVEELTRLQRLAADGILASAMAGFIRWLANDDRLAKARKTINDCKTEWRALKGGAHSRTPDSLAELEAGLKVLAAFALDIGATTNEQAEELLSSGRAALLELGKAQREHLSHADPANKLLSLLSSGLAAGRCHLADKETSKEPAQDADLFGWRWRDVGTGQYQREEAQPQGERIGWIDKDRVLLEPETAVRVAQTLGSDTNDSLGASSRSLGRLLKERGYLLQTDKGRSDSKVRIGKHRPRVWILPMHLFTGDSGPSGPQPPGAESYGDTEEPACSEKAEEAGPQLGPVQGGPDPGPADNRPRAPQHAADPALDGRQCPPAPGAPERGQRVLAGYATAQTTPHPIMEGR